ncbi:putative MFS multidrug transporter [Hypoxylon sp. NC1633]|nr:putative MFS multidrug transporter [Hypoxylon sp. NC1633]
MAEAKTPPQSRSRETEDVVITNTDNHTKDVTPTEDVVQASSGQKANHEQEQKYPPFATLLVIMMSLYLTTFLVALDQTIIGTATPRISDAFNALDDIGWYGSAYLLTTCTFQLLFGRLYTLYAPKTVYITAVILFEAGSALCGAAPTSAAFVCGRALAGVGAAGISNGTVVIMVHAVPLAKRPLYIGFMGGVYGVASVVGPLLGGAFVDDAAATWRWCFYVNLPVGGAAVAVVVLLLRLPAHENKDASRAVTLAQRVRLLDPLGTLFFFPGVVCLLLALQWGGSTYAWGNGRIVALLVVFGLCMIAFVAVQRWKGDTATVAPRIFLQRSMLAGAWAALFSGAALMIALYYLPLWFQAIYGASAVRSGVMIVPTILALVVANIIAGIVVARVGYYAPFLIASSVFMAVGSGMLSTFTPTTGQPAWIGYQVLFGFGVGLGMQQPGMAAQTVLAKKDVPTGVALMFFFRNLGGAVFVSVGQNVFENALIDGLRQIPGLDADAILHVGATGLRDVVDSRYLQGVLVAYNNAVVKVFYCGVAVSCATIVGAVAMEWRSVKKAREQQMKDAEKGRAKKDADIKGADAV